MTSQRPSATPRPRILVIENDLEDPVARLGEWLRQAGATLDVRSLPAGDALPTTMVGFDGLVVMGGWQHANSELDGPWFPALRELMAAAVAERLPVLGVCLGGQLLALAAGGRVAPGAFAEYGPQLVAKRQAAAGDALFKQLPITPDVLQWHRDEVTQLPPGAVLLASSPTCEVQAFRVGPCAWGLQFHIETTPEMVQTWAASDAEELEDYDLARILARSAAVHPDLLEVWQPVAQRFCAVAADPSIASEPRGLPMAAAVTTARPITDPAAIRAALAAELQASREPHRH
jgi:GMP synthase (glutamine-hydrolysing)